MNYDDYLICESECRKQDEAAEYLYRKELEMKELIEKEKARVIAETKRMTKAQLIEEIVSDRVEQIMIAETAREYMSRTSYIKFTQELERISNAL